MKGVVVLVSRKMMEGKIGLIEDLLVLNRRLPESFKIRRKVQGQEGQARSGG